MAFLQALGHLLGSAAHTVNNDIVKPVQRDAINPVAQAKQPVANGLVHLWQLANPNSGANQGAALQQQANDAYHFTPAFNQLISSAHPSLNSHAFGANGILTPQSQALGESLGTQQTNPKLVNEIQLAKGLRGVNPQVLQDALVHEGLHQQWAQASNQQKDQFFQAYNKLMASNSQDAQNLKGYLTSRLSGYQQAPKTTLPMRVDAGGVPIGNDAYNNIGNLDPEIQNEVHSFIPQYFAHINTANPLTQYYSQYFKPSGAQIPTQNTLSALSNTVPGIFPGMNNKPDWLTAQQQAPQGQGGAY